MKKLGILLILVSFIAQGQIKRVEPPFWWVGMNNTHLELVVYGKNINRFNVKIKSSGVVLTKVQKTENPNYLFVDLDLSKAKAGTFKLLFSHPKLKNFKYKYTLKARQKNAASRKSFDNSDVIYLLMPDRFANGNPNNDSSSAATEKANRTDKGGRHGGDIQGVINHLDYIKELGATTIWSTPLLEDNLPTYSYHGYAITDTYKIDPRYGTNQDYKNLATEAHKKGLKLVMDYVTNHWGSLHWMIKDLPTKNWVHQFPKFQRSNYRMTTQFDAYASKIDAHLCMDGWFDTTMPDLNQSNPLVLKYLIQNAIWWIEYAGLDGLRVDTYSYNDKKGIAAWTKAITDEYPNFNIAGEVMMHQQSQIAYWQKDSKLAAIQNYNSHLPAVMDFTLHDAVAQVFNEDKATWDKGMIKVYKNFANDYLYPNPYNTFVFIENHDTNRFNQIYKSDFNKYKLAMALIATVRGIPQIYYGSEIGMMGDKNQGDGDIRRDFPGGWTNDKQNAFTAAGRNDAQQKWFAFTKKLLNWRQKNTAVQTGKFSHYIPQNNVYVYFRHDTSKTVMVVLNNNAKAQILSLQRFSENLKGFTKGTDVLSGESFDFTNTSIKVKGKTPLIIELY
ncbi:MAG: glycoside hydrolase family 13 protein [Flavobacteriaceae bacterium]|nr:glycoside hydrolase family 13 protein [Flavobacteriaceae bacterium]